METNAPRSITEPVMFETQDLPRQMMQRANDEIESLRQRVAELEKERDELVAALKQFAECDLNDDNCASFEVATRRIRSLAQAALAKLGAGETAHNWVCISPGEYDSLYECRRCGARHMEQADRLGSDRPRFGCTYN